MEDVTYEDCHGNTLREGDSVRLLEKQNIRIAGDNSLPQPCHYLLQFRKGVIGEICFRFGSVMNKPSYSWIPVEFKEETPLGTNVMQLYVYYTVLERVEDANT
jgi:hypothetical protein